MTARRDLPEQLDCERAHDCDHPDCCCPVRLHTYIPDWRFMGDCKICGHVEDSPVHLKEESKRWPKSLFDQP